MFEEGPRLQRPDETDATARTQSLEVDEANRFLPKKILENDCSVIQNKSLHRLRYEWPKLENIVSRDGIFL